MSASASCMPSLAKPFASSGFQRLTAPSAWRRRGYGSGNAPPASASSALVGWCTPLRDDRELDIGDEHRDVLLKVRKRKSPSSIVALAAVAAHKWFGRKLPRLSWDPNGSTS